MNAAAVLGILAPLVAVAALWLWVRRAIRPEASGPAPTPGDRRSRGSRGSWWPRPPRSAGHYRDVVVLEKHVRRDDRVRREPARSGPGAGPGDAEPRLSPGVPPSGATVDAAGAAPSSSRTAAEPPGSGDTGEARVWETGDGLLGGRWRRR